MATHYSIEVSAPVYEAGEFVGYDGHEVWSGPDIEVARRTLTVVREEFNDTAAVIREYVDNVMTREIT